jgi:amino acid permease
MSAGDHKMSGGSDLEAEKDFPTSDDASSHQSLHRQLKNRHIAMIR